MSRTHRHRNTGWRLGTSSLLSVTLLAVSAAQDSPACNQPVLYYGLSDASAVAMLDSTHFAVADDEMNVIRVYGRHGNGQPVYSLDLSPFLSLRRTKKCPEADLEGAAALDGRIYWITSHGTTAKGRNAPGRQCIFATTGSVSNNIVDLRPIGRPYRRLLEDMLEDHRLSPLNLRQAARLAPAAPGALNIEGLTETPEGHLLIGFRSPAPQGKALLIPLLNPAELVEGHRAQFGDPMLLNLDGFGIRSITFWRGQYHIVAGPPQGGGRSHLYTWQGHHNTPTKREDFHGFAQLNPESMTFTTDPEGDRFCLVSDDGTRWIEGMQNKKLKDISRRQFRVLFEQF